MPRFVYPYISDLIYLHSNWLIFDKNKVFKTAGYQRLSNTPREFGQDVAHEKLSTTLNITEPGYVYIYLSNEEPTGTPVEVYFDDFKVTHTKSPVVQGEDYYPFGLAFGEYRRDGSFLNSIQFQNQEKQDELDLGWSHFKWRMHDPAIGRFFCVDPLSEKYYYNSVYAFSENKVVAHRELEGLESKSVNKESTDKNQRATSTELNRRASGQSPDLKVIPKENTTNTKTKSGATGLNFQSGDKPDKPQPAPRQNFTATRPLPNISYSSKNGDASETNIFQGNVQIKPGQIVESATLDISVDVANGTGPQTMSIQQGNFQWSGQNAQGPELLCVDIPQVGGNFSTSIPLTDVSPNTNLSVQFSGSTTNQVTVSGSVTIKGTQP